MTGRHLYYDRRGAPISVLEWGAARLKSKETVIDRTELPRGVRVITTWIGFDTDPDSPAPLIFETMVIGGPYDGEKARYATEQKAREGHCQVVARCKEVVL